MFSPAPQPVSFLFQIGAVLKLGILSMGWPTVAFGGSSLADPDLDRSWRIFSAVSSPVSNRFRDFKDDYYHSFESPNSSVFRIHYWGPTEHCQHLGRFSGGTPNIDNHFIIATKSLVKKLDNDQEKQFLMEYSVCGLPIAEQVLIRRGNSYPAPLPSQKIRALLEGEENLFHPMEDSDDFVNNEMRFLPTRFISVGANMTAQYQRIDHGSTSSFRNSTIELNDLIVFQQRWDMTRGVYRRIFSLPPLSSFSWRPLPNTVPADLIANPSCQNVTAWFSWPRGKLTIRGNTNQWVDGVSFKVYNDCFNLSLTSFRNDTLALRSSFLESFYPREPPDPGADGGTPSALPNEDLIDDLETIVDLIEDGSTDEAIEDLEDLIELAEQEQINDAR